MMKYAYGYEKLSSYEYEYEVYTHFIIGFRMHKVWSSR